MALSSEDNIYHDRLYNRKEPICFVGESDNLSLPTALAIMRKDPRMRNIWACLWGYWDHSAEDAGTSKFTDELKIRVKNNKTLRLQIPQYHWNHVDVGCCSKTETKLEKDYLIQAEKAVIRFTDKFRYTNISDRVQGSVDATCLQDHFQEMRNIVFQCPWTRYKENLSMLICDFFHSASQIQKEGGVVFLGLTTDPQWSKYYRNSTHNFEDVAKSLGYRPYPPDKKFPEAAIRHGYKHECMGPGDIHDTLVRERSLEIRAFLRVSIPEQGSGSNRDDPEDSEDSSKCNESNDKEEEKYSVKSNIGSNALTEDADVSTLAERLRASSL